MEGEDIDNYDEDGRATGSVLASRDALMLVVFFSTAAIEGFDMDSSTIGVKPASNDPPSRPFAALGFVTLVAVCMAGVGYVAWRRPTSVALLHGLVVLPGILWAGHRLLNGARGIAPTEPHWPFATQRIATGYFLILIAISLFAGRLY